MQGNLAEVIRELMDAQHLSVRKVSARIAEKHGGSVYGYTQQVSRILNDPNYDPTLSTVQKILSALNVSFWQVNRLPKLQEQHRLDDNHISDRLDQLSTDMADLKLAMAELQEAVKKLL
ncbi:helix-turn-helix transcriptional regulator [Oscillatoria sp. FACHB-1407]|uniref:helix-turn-helix domain-containing protein n=1 Tax=Oscillatoria sp. FACHB-1407 TaxID=2692847 RepID=UPI0016866AB3|nr:helix-turn-helix transcriptional regulator [Oscillatoria sp. FACHB-1407]MBD2464701.1 helix-turn-helix transcriptional regulator [Oscillatoria sp. FACHB-1407]